MRKAFTRLLRQTCTIYRKQTTDADASGEVQVSFLKIAENVKCLINQISGFQIVKYQGLGVQAQYELFVPYDTDLKIGDKIVQDTHVLYVTFQDTMVGDQWKHHKVAALRLEVNENGV